MKSILLSFSPYWFNRVQTGEIKFEYRKALPDEPVKVFYYVSSPVKAISGISYFSNRELLANWLDKYKDRPASVIERIKNDLSTCKYVVNIDSFQSTNSIPLTTLRQHMPNFIVPRMYYYIDGTILENYLIENLIPTNKIIINNFDNIHDNEICPE